MADTVTGPTILQQNDVRVVIKLVQSSDGTGKTTVFGDVSALAANENGDSVAHLNLQRIWFSCSSGNGFDSYGRLDEEDSDGDIPILGLTDQAIGTLENLVDYHQVQTLIPTVILML